MADSTSFRRGLALLAAVGSESALAAGGSSVTSLADELGMDKGQVSRMLRALSDAGLVERDPGTRAYRLGWGLFAMAARAGDQRLLDVAGPLLTQMVTQVGERGHLSVLQGSDVITVLTESPPLAVQTAGWVGRPVPAAYTSAGRALLLDHGPAELDALLGSEPLRPPGRDAPVDLAQLHERIVAAATAGFAVVDEEFEPGLLAVAAPVRDASGRIIASLNVSAPRFRLIDGVAKVAAIVVESADQVSRGLGFIPATKP